MKFRVQQTIIAIPLVISLVLSFALTASNNAEQSHGKALGKDQLCGNGLNGEIFARTELYFGLSRPNGSVITEKEWKHFIDSKVTPLFPNGMTLLTGTGQFKDSTGKVIKENSKLLILLYPFNTESNDAIEQIRKAYTYTFQQASVLRVDEQSCVSF